MIHPRLLPLCVGALLGLSACMPDSGSVREVAERRAAPEILQAMPAMNQFGTTRPAPPERSNAAIAADFLDLSFQMESGRRIERLSRFEGPITIAAVPGGPASLSLDLDRLVNRFRQEAGIDIRRVPHAGGTANITIETLPRAQMQRIVPEAACFRRAARQFLGRVPRRPQFTRDGLDDARDTRAGSPSSSPTTWPPQEVRDCLHEEVAQAMGPLNDLYRLHDFGLQRRQFPIRPDRFRHADPAGLLQATRSARA